MGLGITSVTPYTHKTLNSLSMAMIAKTNTPAMTQRYLVVLPHGGKNPAMTAGGK